MNFNITSILGDLEKGAIDAAKEVAIEQLKEAAADAIDFVKVALPAISRYADLYLSNRITADEFGSLMAGLGDLAEMNGLTQAGVAAVKIDETKNVILKTITSIATGAITKII